MLVWWANCRTKLEVLYVIWIRAMISPFCVYVRRNTKLWSPRTRTSYSLSFKIQAISSHNREKCCQGKKNISVRWKIYKNKWIAWTNVRVHKSNIAFSFAHPIELTSYWRNFCATVHYMILEVKMNWIKALIYPQKKLFRFHIPQLTLLPELKIVLKHLWDEPMLECECFDWKKDLSYHCSNYFYYFIILRCSDHLICM